MAGRVIVLLLLVAILAAGGIVWFDYLNVIDAKAVLSPLTRFIGRQGRSQPKTAPDEDLNLDAERLAVRLEALNLRNMEIDTRQKDLDSRYGEIEQMAQELRNAKKRLMNGRILSERRPRMPKIRTETSKRTPGF